MSKTIDWPSGETSSESQVPLVVVKSWERVALRGSDCGGGVAPPAAGAPCAASAETESEEIAIRRAERDRRLSIGRKPLYMVVTAGMGLRGTTKHTADGGGRPVQPRTSDRERSQLAAGRQRLTLSTSSGQLTAISQRPHYRSDWRTCSLPVGLANVLHQAGEHAADLDHFLLANRELAAGDYGGIGGELEMIFDLGRGGQRHLQEFREVLVGRAAGPLCDVRRNRERRSLKLANQPCMAATGNPFREPMNIQRDRVRLPPHGESSIALHFAEAKLALSGAVIAEVRVGSISRAGR